MNDESETLSAADRAEYLDRLYRAVDSDTVIKEVAKHAAPYLPWLRRCGIACHKRMAEELAIEAIEDAITGKRRWDGVVPIVVCLANSVRSRVNHMMEHAQLFPSTSIEDAWANDESYSGEDARDGEIAEAAAKRRDNAAPSTRPGRMITLKDAARRLLAWIKTAAPLDLPIRRILEAWSQGHIDRGDAIKASGLAEAHYDAACKRIKSIALSLPEELVTGVVDALEVTYG